MGTITTYNHCVVNITLNKFAVGSKEEIVNQLFEWKLEGKSKRLLARHHGFKQNEYFSFGQESSYNEKEQYQECITKLFSVLKDYGYKNYRDIGF